MAVGVGATSFCVYCMPASVQGKVTSYLKLARIHNMVPSMLLVVVGAWVGHC